MYLSHNKLSEVISKKQAILFKAQQQVSKISKPSALYTLQTVCIKTISAPLILTVREVIF
jgi:hypothetical protein